MEKPIRILHIVGNNLERAGIETWLRNIIRKIDKTKFQVDVMVLDSTPGDYDQDVQEDGAKLLVVQYTNNLLKFYLDVRKAILAQKPYHIIHSHPHHFSALMLAIGATCGIPIRVAHCHNDRSVQRIGASLLRKFYLAFTEWVLQRVCYAGIAVSEPAAVDLFGKNWKKDPRWKILYCIIDVLSFEVNEDKRAELRQALDIPKDALVIGHVGRLAKAKNHSFLLDIASKVMEQKPNTRVLIIGEGNLKSALEKKSAALGISDRIIFAGSRPDVNLLMCHVMDVFVFPSFFEGLPLVQVEAQAAGLPMVISDVITEEADLVPENIIRHNINEPAEQWAKSTLEVIDRKIDRKVSYQRIFDSPFNLESSITILEKFYLDIFKKHFGKS